MNNQLIEASAGTGKTQALANRLIDLLVEGEKPQNIVALTFSRAAAGEIFERFVQLLADYALNGRDGDASPERKCEYARLLRETIATQHLSQIGTLDSFLMRVLRSFPLELGLVGKIGIMDEFEAESEQARLSFSILRRTDERLKKKFVDAFYLAMNRENVRSFMIAYRGFIKEWHQLYLSERDEAEWGNAARIWSDECLFPVADVAELAAAADGIAGFVEGAKWRDFQQWIRSFRGSLSELKGFAKAFIEQGGLFSGNLLEVVFSRKTYCFDAHQTAALRRAFRAVFGFVLARKLELAQGIFRIIAPFEREYQLKVRSRGKIVFADVPRMIAALSPQQRLALEYRMDSRIRAWAFDEFQDTSREQWRAIANLVDEARQSADGKSVFLVGDTKQAIYGWRNGDVRIFAAEKDSHVYENLEKLQTYRSSPAVVEAVNKIFAYGPVKDRFPAWRCGEHVSAKKDLTGWVQTAEATGASMDDFVGPVKAALEAVDPLARGLSAAILVRSNTFGEYLVNELKARGMANVVWEGESDILDTVALGGFLDLVALCDHPGDMLAYRHFLMTPLAARKYPRGVPEAAEISREMAELFTSKGLVRGLRELRTLLPENPAAAWSEFTESRFTDMLRAAGEFELKRGPQTRLSDFADFLQSRTKRSLADAGSIRVMTIHRSKGLGFDYVVLPLYEPKGLCRNPDGPLVEPGRWVLPDPGVQVAANTPELAGAYTLRQDRVEQEALCTYYVSMTRAKRMMSIILHPAPKTASATVRFSDLVRAGLGVGAIGDPSLLPDLSRENAPAPTFPAEMRFAAVKRAARERTKRRMPSSILRSGMSAGTLFAPSGGKQAMAMDIGTEIHCQLARIEWLAAEAAHDPFARELVKPPGAVELWRERAYEIFHDGVWESGQFDRVVFLDTPQGRSAIVYDFKTNRPQRGECAADFVARMRTTYTPQLCAYRAAITQLAGIPPGRVACRLLMVRTRGVIEI